MGATCGIVVLLLMPTPFASLAFLAETNTSLETGPLSPVYQDMGRHAAMPSLLVLLLKQKSVERVQRLCSID